MKKPLPAVQSFYKQLFARRVVSGAVVGVLALFGVLLAVDLMSSREAEMEDIGKDSDNLTRLLERQVSAVIEKTDVVLRETAHQYSPAVNGPKKRDLLEANLDLNHWMDYIPEAQKESLRVVNDQGRVVYNAGVSEKLPDVVVADRAYFLHQKEDPNAGLVLSEPLLSRFTGKWLITLSRRMTKDDGSFGGLVQTALRTEYFQSLFEGLDVGAHGNVSLFDTDLRLLSRLPARPEQLGKSINNPELTGFLKSGAISGNYEVDSRVDGVHRLFVFRKLQGLPYVVVIGRAPSDFLSGWNRKAVLYSLGYLGLVLAVLRQLSVLQRHSEQNRRLVTQVFETSREGIVVTDATGVILTANPAFTTITGYPLEEAVGQTNGLLRSERHDVSFYAELWSELREKGEWRGELWNRRKNGEDFRQLLSANAIRDAAGQVTNFIGIFSDITELHQTRQQAEVANRAKGEFLATMSHEIRTPMNGIIGMTGLLLDTKLSKEQRHFAEIIRTSSESLLTIINDILDFSRIESGRLELEEYPFEINSMIEGVADLLAPRVVGKHLEMSVYVDPELRGEFQGDAGRVRQVIMNLVGNAIKFTEKGSVSITANRLLSHHGSEQMHLRVVDTGIGIPDEAHDKLFGKFSQADASTARRFGGSGLGLAISRGIVNMLGGEIGFDSETGKGSCFWFTIPLRRLSRGWDSNGEHPLDGLKVLVVDDTPANLEVFSRQLEGWGASCVAVDSAVMGLQKLRESIVAGRPFDVAILDHNMPGMTGVDLANVVRSDPALQTLPLILASSAPDPRIGDNPDAFGFSLVMTKPIRPSILLDSLMMTIGHQVSEENSLKAELLRRDINPMKVSLRILVAEDNAINQQVATGLLARLGHRADVANDGGEAVVLVDRGDYDLVLMDVQMPNMDGIAATAAIRALPSHKARLPIIAMTANAMAGDRESFLDKGMDDYISKPINRRSLETLLERWSSRIKDGKSQGPVQPSAPPPDSEGLIDPDTAQELTEELGAERYNALKTRFLDELPDIIDRIGALLTAGDATAASRAAHNIKGSGGNLGFFGIMRDARDIEDACRSGTDPMGGLARLRASAQATIELEKAGV